MDGEFVEWIGKLGVGERPFDAREDPLSEDVATTLGLAQGTPESCKCEGCKMLAEPSLGGSPRSVGAAGAGESDAGTANLFKSLSEAKSTDPCTGM
jgi:hypothetical protein